MKVYSRQRLYRFLVGGQIDALHAAQRLPAALDRNAPLLRDQRKLLRLRGKGVPDLRGGPAGDLVARIVFEVPQRLTGKQRGLLEDLAKSLDDSNFPGRRDFAAKLKTFYAHKEKLRK